MTDMSVLTLYAPRIPGWQAVVPGAIDAHGGIPLALTYLYPGQGVKVLVDAYLEQLAEDSIDLYLNGVVVDVAIVKSTTDKLFTLYLPVQALLDGLNTIHYTVRRGSENIDSSTTLRAWFHKRRPGLKDLEGNHEWHSELAINVLPPNVLDDGVDPEQARQGVICTASYPLTRAFDKIRVRCGGETIDHVVTEDEARSGDPVQVRIEEAVFKKIGDTAKCVLTYTVWDWIGNSVDLDALWSAALELFVSLNGIWLEPPLVSEDPNDASDDPDSIDLGKLAGRPAIAQVHAQRSWQRNDVIELTCTFKTASGTSEVLILKESVASAPFIYKLSVPHAHFVAAVGGSATFKYKLLRAGKEVGRSFTTRVDVIGEALIDLPLVTVVGVPGLVVDPLASLAGQIARVEFAQAQTGDQCQLFARPVTADGLPTFTAKAFNANNRVNNTLTIEDLVARHGTVIRLTWELTRNGVKTRSNPTLLTVQKIADGDSRLPTPKVPQAPDDKVLDLSRFEGDAEVKVLPWLGIRVGQDVELKCVGIDSAGAEYVIPLLGAHKVTAAEVSSGLSVPMLRQKLLGLKTGSPLTVTLRVLFGQAASPVAPVLFPVLSLNVLVVAPVTSEDFEAVDNNSTIPPGRYLDIPSMRITNLSGPDTLTIWAYGPNIPGQVNGKGLYSRGVGQRTRLDLRLSYSKITFWHWETQLTDNYVHFYNEKGEPLGSQVLQLSHPGSPVQVVFSAVGIKRIEIQHTFSANDGIQLDSFTFTP
ncbi:hypothetical protein [Pseudomonas fluorescens]|uniref:Uncharacterized protein n=1 Tax=Pseudomonas fluorescens TaxID=294 RepID=A0A0F4TIH7_PSEFL|nr:hypothetical protein [Pseudomonas fluorescens]KJZ43212.1 hypothetical protein VC34_14605 [Pseudomonas fluorescens]